MTKQDENLLARGNPGVEARLQREAEIEACPYCQANKGQMHPPHFASSRCESGKRNHCSCDTCF